MLWFGTQSNQTSLAPSIVVASQVYHWEGILKEMIALIQSGTLGGKSFTANLANGGEVIEFNPDYTAARRCQDTGRQDHCRHQGRKHQDHSAVIKSMIDRSSEAIRASEASV